MRGVRHGGREAYLDPARGRETLAVRTGARAHRIQRRKRARRGRRVREGGQRRFARARQEVIVSAGAVQSPHLLELSGIGDRERLASFGIAPVVHLPGVGENCRDHLHTRISFECTCPITLNDMLGNPLRQAWMGLRYLVRRDGPMAACTAMVHALAKSDPSLDRPDVKIQMHTLSAEDPRDPREAGARQIPGLWHRQLRPSAALARLGAPRIRRSGGTARHHRQLPRRSARSRHQHRRPAAGPPHRRSAGA